MPSPARGDRSGNRRLIVAVVPATAAAAAAVAAHLTRGRARARPYGLAQQLPSPSAAPVPASGRPGTLPAPASSAAPVDATAHVEHLRHDTQFTAQDGAGTLVRYSISLPDDYHTTSTLYPVVYALHGKTQSNVSFMDQALSLRTAMTGGVLEPSIIVTPDSYGTGRWENRDEGPAEDNLIKHLIPHVEQNYRARPGPSYRLLTGFSMGGHVAIRLGLKHPGMFAAVWSVDGAMAASADYLPFIEGRSAGDFRIIAVGGRHNGNRVRRLVGDLRRHGVQIPHDHQRVHHDFVAFVRHDERLGWPALRYLQRNLGRTFS